jgi:2-desacetyl-2-hydroxyethyl bacteriochlorophyllide A dehydrogenase
MKVFEITADRSLAPVDRPAPRASGSYAEVAVAFCGVCGSDLHMLHDKEFPAGSVLGHEFSGVVTAVGPDVTTVEVGDRVAVLPYESCARCRYCTTGRENLCVSGGHFGGSGGNFGGVLGVDRPGGLSAPVLAEDKALVKLPGDATLEQGALAEPVAVALRAAGRVASAADEQVVVVGGGPIGILVALILGVKGFGNVSVIERNATRRAIAESVGLRVVAADDSDPLDQLTAYDAATFIDCSGAPQAIAAQIAAVRRGGRVVLVGLGAPVEFDASDAVLKEAEVVGSAGYSRTDFSQAVELLASGAIPTSALITRIADIDQAADVFAELSDPGTAHVKVLLRH